MRQGQKTNSNQGSQHARKGCVYEGRSVYRFSGPLSLISLSHSDNRSESTTKVYSSSKADVGGNVLMDVEFVRTEI